MTTRLLTVLLLSLLPTIILGSIVTHPNIDFNPIQELILSGSYNGISLYKDTRQLTSIPKTTASLISLSNDTLQLLSTSNLNGNIYDSCILNKNTLIIAGNFTTVNGKSINNIASISLDDNSISSLGNGIDGPIYSVLCDNSDLYVGGSFIAPSNKDIIAYSNSLSQFGGSVALWKNKQWTGLPWKGLNGPVHSIIKDNKNQIIFGGKFDTTTDGQSFHAPASQPISIPTSGVSATSGTNPASILCQSSSSWLLNNSVQGTWQTNFVDYSVNPSLVRIMNSKVENHQTKEFAIRSLTDPTINYPLSYLDPVTGLSMTCTNNCTLSNDPSVTYQDFRIMNQSLTSGIAIDIKSWYGVGGGLSYVKVFQSEIFAYAVNPDPTNPCIADNSTVLTKIETTGGTWTETSSTTSPYLSYAVKSANDTASVTFYPNLAESGIYEVLIYTPACTTAGCTDRTDVDIAIGTATTTTISNITMSQKYVGSTSVYTGYFDLSASFKPTVKFSLGKNATITTGNTANVVAFAVQFVKGPSTDALSSILQYNSTQKNITVSSLAWGAFPDNVPYQSLVNTMELLANGDVYIGGTFNGIDKSNAKYDNIVRFDSTTNQLKSLPNGGLNGPVQSIAAGALSDIYVGGNFTDTKTASTAQLNNVAKYNSQTLAWSALNAGVNGPVASVNSISNTILVSGQFTQLKQSNKVSGNAWWDTQTNQWVFDNSLPYLSGIIYNAFSNDNVNYFMGSITSAQRYQSNGISFVSSADNLTSPSFDPQSQQTLISSGVLFTDNNGASSTSSASTLFNTPTTIFGGQFTLSNNIQNIAIYNSGNNTWSGLQGVDWQTGAINTMAVNDGLLYVGGRFSGTASNNLAVFNLSNRSLSLSPNVQTNDGSPAKINSIRSIPSQNIMAVGGNFTSIGSLACSSICAFNTASFQWSSLGSGLLGEVYDMVMVNNKLVTSGNFTLNNSPLTIAQFDFSKNTWGPFSTANLPGPSQAISYDNVTNSLYVVGQNTDTSSTYLRIWNGQEFNPPSVDIGPGSVISKLSMVPLVNSTSQKNILLATGNINLGSIGNVSAAFYDGQSWIPYLVVSSADEGATNSLSNLFYLDQPYIAAVIKKFLPTPIVILVAIAVSLGIVFMVVLGAMIAVFIKRKRDSKVNPESNPAAYYGKPPRTPESLLTMLKDSSPDDKNSDDTNYNNHNSMEKSRQLESETHQFYNMSKSISTDHLQEQQLTPFNGAAAMTTARAAPLPPTAHSRPISNHINAFVNMSPAAAVAGGTAMGAITAMGMTRPESFARPLSEYQRDTFYNNDYTMHNNSGEMMEISKRNSYNPFRNSEIGLTVGGGAMAATANNNGFANSNSRQIPPSSGVNYFSNSNAFSPSKVQQKGQPVAYANIPPANVSTAIVTPAITDSIAVAGAAGAAAFAAANFNNKSTPKVQQSKGAQQSTAFNKIPVQTPSSLSINSGNVRWTTAPTEAASVAVVKPISLVGTSDESSLLDPISGPQAQHFNQAPSPSTLSGTSSDKLRWTQAPSSKDAMGTAIITPNLAIAVNTAKDDRFSQQSNINVTENMANSSSLSVNSTLSNVVPASTNVRWTNFNHNNAVSVAVIEPDDAKQSTYHDHGSFYSPVPLNVADSSASNQNLLDTVKTASQGFSSDPDFARWTTAPTATTSNTTVEPISPIDDDNDDRASSILGIGQYQASLSSVAWPQDMEFPPEDLQSHEEKTHSNDEIANTVAAPSFNNYKDDVNTKVIYKDASRFSDAESLPPIDTNIFPTTNQKDALLSPDSAVRWKKINIGSPIETVFAPHILEPASATVTRRSAANESDDESQAFENYYHPKPQQAQIVSSTSTTSTKSATKSFTNSDSKSVNSPIKSYQDEPIGRKSEAIDEVIANRDLNALSTLIQDEEVEPLTTPIPTNTRSTNNGAGAADGRAASKRMVEEYLTSRNNKPVEDKKSKYKSDFKSVMATAILNNTKSAIATEDHPHLYYAKFDFSAREAGELGFEKADPIIVVDSSDDIWWMGYKANKSDGSYIQGVFPSNYVEIAVELKE